MPANPQRGSAVHARSCRGPESWIADAADPRPCTTNLPSSCGRLPRQARRTHHEPVDRVGAWRPSRIAQTTSDWPRRMAAVAVTVRTNPLLTSTPTCAFIPKCPTRVPSLLFPLPQMIVGLSTVGLVHKHHEFARSACEVAAKRFNCVGGGDVARHTRDPRHGRTRKPHLGADSRSSCRRTAVVCCWSNGGAAGLVAGQCEITDAVLTMPAGFQSR